MKRSLLAVPVLYLAATACAAESSPGPELRVNAQSIAGGESDSETKHVLGMFSFSGHGGGMCTGTLIAPNLVLTARHCIAPPLKPRDYVICGDSGFADPYPGYNIVVTHDMKMSQGSNNWRRGADVRVPSQGNDTCGFDIALVILAEPVDDITPAVPRIDTPVETGEAYTAIGYGNTGTQNSGGSRMSLGGLQVQCTPGNCPIYHQVQSTEWLGQTGVCQGDSGGPAIDKDGKVIGVVSRGSGQCNSPTYGSVWAWKDFIMETALEAATLGGYEPPFWAVSGVSDDPNPEPPVKQPKPTAGPDAQGTICGEGIPCPSGYACFAPGGGENPYCAADCGAGADCASGLECLADLNICAAPLAAEADAESNGGCSVSLSSENGPVRPVPWLVGLGLALLALRRRR